MNGRVYVDIITIDGIDIYAVVVDPNGVLTAPIGSIATLKTSPQIWVNADGATTWNQVYPGSGSGGGLSQEVWVDSNAAPGGSGSATDPFATIQAAINAAALSGYSRWKINVIPGTYPGAVSFPEGFDWTLAGAGTEETLVSNTITWTAIDGDSLQICGCTVTAVAFVDGSVPPASSSYLQTNCTVGSLSVSPGTGVFHCYVSTDVARVAFSGSFDTRGLLSASGPVTFGGTIGCTQIWASGCFFSDDIVVNGVSLSFETCRFLAPVVVASVAGTATMDPISAQNFVAAGGTFVATTLSIESLRGGFSVLGSGLTTSVQGSLSVGEESLLTGVNSPAAIAGANNDYGALSSTVSIGRISASAPGASITGLTGGVAGRLAILINVGTDAITLVHDSGASAASNRILISGNADFDLEQNGSIILWWDTASSRWRNASTSRSTIPSGGLSQEFWVDSNAAPGGIGSALSPFSSIQAAITAAAATAYTSWQINVIPGTYPGAVSFPEGFQWRLLGSGVEETQINVIVDWTAVTGDSLSIQDCTVNGVNFIDGTVPPASADFFSVASVLGTVTIAVGTGLFDCHFSTDVARTVVAGPLTTRGALTADGPCDFVGAIGCSSIDAYGCSFSDDITLTGATAAFETCRFLAPVVLTSAAGTATMDPISAQSFVAAGGTLVTTTLSLESLRGGFSVLGSGLTTIVQGSFSVGESFFLTGVNTPAAIAGANNDYGALPSTVSVARISASAPGASVTGLSGGVDGRLAIVTNIGSDSISLVHDSGASAASNRMLLPGATNLTLRQNDSVLMWWDTTSSRWRLASSTNGSGSSTAPSTVEVDLGADLLASGTFDITGLSGLTPGQPVFIQQAPGPYTGKPYPDEAELSPLWVVGYVFDATTIRCYWNALNGTVNGNFIFLYEV